MWVWSGVLATQLKVKMRDKERRKIYGLDRLHRYFDFTSSPAYVAACVEGVGARPCICLQHVRWCLISGMVYPNTRIKEQLHNCSLFHLYSLIATLPFETIKYMKAVLLLSQHGPFLSLISLIWLSFSHFFFTSFSLFRLLSSKMWIQTGWPWPNLR